MTNKQYIVNVKMTLFHENEDKALKQIKRQLDRLERLYYVYSADITEIKEITKKELA